MGVRGGLGWGWKVDRGGEGGGEERRDATRARGSSRYVMEKGRLAIEARNSVWNEEFVMTI